MCRGRHCLTRQTASLPGQTLSHPAHSLSARSDIVSPDRQPLWPGRHCLTQHTASLASQTHPAAAAAATAAAAAAYMVLHGGPFFPVVFQITPDNAR